MNSYFLISLITIFCLISCRKKDIKGKCSYPDIIPFQTYSDPVWHPNGKLIGFNHTPQTDYSTNGSATCLWYLNSINIDSSGFYLMNKDGTNFRRVTNYFLSSPSWSPDGNWLAFVLDAQIYKIHFNGQEFDTASIIKLTEDGANYFPAWTSQSDTIFYDSNLGNSGGSNFYAIWKMNSDGIGKVKVTRSVNLGDERQPYVGNNGLIYYMGYSKSQPEIFSMKRDGSESTQITNNGKNGNRGYPKYWNGKLIYNDNGVLRIKENNTENTIVTPCVTYDISKYGEVVYSKMSFDITSSNKQNGTLWIINLNDTQDIQITSNNF